MMPTFNVAIAGATGAVGRTIMQVLEERNFPINKLYLLASASSAGKKVKFKNQDITVQSLADFDFTQAQIGLFSPGGAVSKIYAPIAAAAGCVVIDNTSEFRYDDDIPLVVPEINPHAVAFYKNRGIISNPNCSTIQMLVALFKIHQQYKIKRINVATYQAVSGSGASAIKELESQTKDILDSKPPRVEVYPKQIAFNVIPQIDKFLDNGYTKEEMKMVWETQKIFEDDNIFVNPTAVRVPVFYGHSEAINIETERKITVDEAKKLLADTDGLNLMDDIKNGVYPTAIDVAGSNEVFVGRVREDLSHPSALNLWVVADNVRKGAATNAVQIAEVLAKNYL